MTPQHFLLKARSFMNSKAMSAFDWLLAIGTIVWGCHLVFIQNNTDWTSYAIIGAGIVGLILAAVKPSRRIESALQKRFIQRS
jgi:hypothetical protein